MDSGCWIRVSPTNRCPICDHSDWCLISRDGTAAICARVESARRAGDAGYLHRSGRAPQPCRVRCERAIESASEIDWAGRIAEAQQQATRHDLDHFARHLGVAPEALRRMRVVGIRNAWGFPHQDGRGNFCGVHLRLPTGGKPYVRGSRPGIAVPEDLGPCDPLVITEGESDCAAALTLGADAIARPGCGSSRQAIMAFIRERQPASIVVFGDSDDPGRQGAEELGAQLSLICRSVRIAFPPPPHKDLRAWLRSGATSDSFRSLIRDARACQFGVEVRLHDRASPKARTSNS